MMGDTILILPTVLLCVIIASLIECFAVLPGHLKRSLAKVKPTRADSLRGRFDAGFIRFRDNRFMPWVRKALDYPGTTVCAALGGVLCTFSLVAAQHVGFNLVTGFDFESLEAQVQFSATATDAQKSDFTQHLQKTLSEVDEAHETQNLVGWLSKTNLATFDEERQTGAQYASVQAYYAFEEDRTQAPAEFVEQWRELMIQPPYVERFHLGVDGGANGGEPDLAMVLRGKSMSDLKAGAQALREVLTTYPGVSNVTDNLPYGKQQLIFTMTPTGNSLGLTPELIGRQLRAGYAGARVQIFNENQSELEVRVAASDAERENLGYLAQFPIKTLTNEWVPLSQVAQIETRSGIDMIRHHNSEMAIRVSADVDTAKNNTLTIIDDVKDKHLDEILNTWDLTFGLAGQSAQDQMMLEVMALGGLLTLVLIYLILAWVFASYLWPLAIMLAIPFGMTGAIAGHWVLGMELGAMSLLAFFSLTGIVVNDSIVLISFFKDEYNKAVEVRIALEHAVRLRFRAVLLTSLTTIAGLVALIFETSTLEMYVAPIAVTLCFGLAFATALVLLVIPAMVLLLESGKRSLHARLLAITRPTLTATHPQEVIRG
jgi:multidrug efflux pump subunit AcrB